MAAERGIVFNIQHFSIQDGSGIRTTVFLKGCPLSCRWCANPESQHTSPELTYCANSCIHCATCLQQDVDGIVQRNANGEIVISPEKAKHVCHYGNLCPAQALSVMGESKTVTEVMDIVEQDTIFYQHSYGGMTLSGGEPLMQVDFAEALLEEAKKRHIHTAVETTGYSSYENVKRIFSKLDFIIYDIKMMDDKKHKTYTGVSNGLILDNFQRMREDFPDTPVLVRTPVIPDINDTEEEICKIRDFVKAFPNTSYELLKFHRLGEPKYEALGRRWEIPAKELDSETWEKLQKIAKK
jgi:pyruvate formate lyase activating enzyme